MKYTVNWVEKNLGVSRKVLRIYEKEKLMDETASRNPDNNYREYSNEDIERIWCYRLLQGIGYSIKDIVKMTQNANYDFQASLSERIIDLERRKTEIEQYIGFAKALKLTGSFPLPKEMGSIRFEDFIKYAREYWNVDTDPQMSKIHNLAETILNKSGSELTEVDIEQVTAFEGINVDDVLVLNEYYIELLKRKESGVSHPVVQTLVNLIYRYYCEHFFSAEIIDGMTPQKFVRYIVRLFTVGDMAKIQEVNYGKDGCKFIAEAFAHFGGYSSIQDVD